jgi:hypothetical protein
VGVSMKSAPVHAFPARMVMMRGLVMLMVRGPVMMTR